MILIGRSNELQIAAKTVWTKTSIDTEEGEQKFLLTPVSQLNLGVKFLASSPSLPYLSPAGSLTERRKQAPSPHFMVIK